MTKAAYLLHSTRGRILVFGLVALLAVLIGMALAGALGGSSAATGSTQEAVSTKGVGTAVQGLCDMQTDFAAGQIDAAKNAFYDKSHLLLHQLAAQVQEKDRDRATSLLIAKYRVEDIFANPGQASGSGSSAQGPSALVSQLLVEVQASASILGISAPQCQ